MNRLMKYLLEGYTVFRITYRDDSIRVMLFAPVGSTKPHIQWYGYPA